MIWQNLNLKKLNLLSIAKGWYLKLIGKQLNQIPYYELQQANIRKSYCDNCPLNTKGWCDTSKEAEDINGEIVNGCGCELEAKRLLKDQSCPRLLWLEMKSENEWNDYIIKINKYYTENFKEQTQETDYSIINSLLNGS